MSDDSPRAKVDAELIERLRVQTYRMVGEAFKWVSLCEFKAYVEPDVTLGGKLSVFDSGPVVFVEWNDSRSGSGPYYGSYDVDQVERFVPEMGTRYIARAMANEIVSTRRDAVSY